MKKVNFFGALTALFCIGMFAACDGDEPNNNNNNGSAGTTKYVVGASSSEAVYLLEAENLDTDDISITGAGEEAKTATAWVFHSGTYAYRLVYNQGNSGTGSSYILDANGNLKERSIAFEITNRFTTYGPYDKYVITGASGTTNNYDAADTEKAYPKYGITFTYLNVETQMLNTKTIVTENLVDDNGEYYTVSGIADAGGKLYTALCPQGYSPYGVWKNQEKISELATEAGVEPESLITQTEGKYNAISTTLHPNRVWMAIYDNVNFENPKIISDDRLSFATSRRQSQFYSTIEADENGNIYVFSAANAKNNADPHKSDKPSGVLRIKAGTETFDKDYYYNIEELSGGRHLYRVYYISDGYFLLRMYANPGESTANKNDTRRLAIFNAANGDFTWVNEGLPAQDIISDFGLFAYAENGLAYIPVVTTDGTDPAIYIIDPATAKAMKGITVNTATSVAAIGKLSYKE
ncbi:DUF4374 domain-containing protein [Paludibacter sp. 221]|uniref:DUF4374 domain-containing protein n=1 Tax=Paludibacter sp. 221 TaxID=2302939 RepID=UPI0013D0B8FA|nr:DUF4374 domain-containing protein [Paludibacter sp. 221]NDV45885.1 DUF4374 domain-containing protein [Paludibacter sp. 221]